MKIDPRAFRGLSRFLAPSAGGPLADRALSEKRITPEQLQECVDLQDRTSRPLDEILVERGYLTLEEVTRFRNPALPPEVDKAAQDPANSLGHYVLVSRAGMGGMAEVWKAWDRSLGRWVAVKYLKEEVGHPAQRIEREGKMAGQLSHPGIITIFERGQHNGRPYLVMPLVNGVPPKPPLAPKEAVRIASEVAKALIHVHKSDIIHRDVKPANVLLESDGRVVLADFGLAIPNSSGASRWAVSGTPEYASPEQIKGDVLDSRTDVYSLGATLYHFLAGRPPFIGSSVKEITDRVLSAPVPSLRNVPRSLTKIVTKAMARDRTRRYASMSAMAEDLEAFLNPIWGKLPTSPRALVAVLVAGALPWMITGIVVWQRNRQLARIDRIESVHSVDGELAHTEQLFADPEVSLENCVVSAAETLGIFRQVRRDLEEDTPELLVGMARCLELMGREGEAEMLFVKAGRSDAASLGLGRICLRRHFAGRRDKDWRKAAAEALDRIKPSMTADLVAVLRDVAAGKSAEALTAAPALLERGQSNEIFQMAVGYAAVERGAWDDAVKRFEQAARLRRSDSTSRYWKGVALAGQGMKPEAIAEFESAIRSAPADWALLAEAERRLEEARR